MQLPSESSRHARLLLELAEGPSLAPSMPLVAGRRDPDARAATMTSDAWLDVPPAALVALIREADCGPLAGDLRSWDVREAAADSFMQRIVYVSRLPWPFRDRAFCICSQVKLLDGGVIQIESRSVEPTADELAMGRGTFWGTVVFSGYRIRSVRGGSHLRRVFEADLGMPLPSRIEISLLRGVFQENHRWLAEGKLHVEGAELARRMQRDPLYAAVDDFVREST